MWKGGWIVAGLSALFGAFGIFAATSWDRHAVLMLLGIVFAMVTIGTALLGDLARLPRRFSKVTDLIIGLVIGHILGRRDRHIEREAALSRQADHEGRRARYNRWLAEGYDGEGTIRGPWRPGPK